MSATGELAQWAAALRPAELPDRVVADARRLLLDHLACALRGARTSSGRAAAATAEALSGGAGRATIVGGGPASPHLAAFANGVAAHSVEMDDTHNEASLHPGVCVIPAALAAAEETGAGGAALIAAMAAGYEVTCRIGRAADPRATYARGFHPTAVCGTFGAATAAGLVMGLGADALRDAMGVAASQSSGLLEFLEDGTWTKRFHAGWSAQAGYQAAALAARGFSAPATALEGERGFLAAFGAGGDAARITAGLGEARELSATSQKPHASCRYNQGPLDLAIRLAQEGDLAAGEIAGVVVGTVTTAKGLVVEPRARKDRPLTEVDAQFSLPYSVASALLRRRATLDELEPEALAWPPALELAARVRWEGRPEYDALFPARWPADLTVTTRDGRTLSARTEVPLGDPDNPLGWEETAAKLRSLAGDALSEDSLSALERMVAELPATLPSELAAALRAPGRRRPPRPPRSRSSAPGAPAR